MLDSIYHLYIRNMSFEDSVEFCMYQKIFQYPDVCAVTIKYWFQKFSSNFCYLKFDATKEPISILLRMEFLLKVKPKCQLWTIDHYMDALKVSEATAKCSGTNINDAVIFLMSRQYFRFPEVCVATIEYWFRKFSTTFYYPEYMPITDTCCHNLKMEFFKKIKDSNPSWTIDHFMDVLKVPKEAAEIYLLTLPSRHSNQQ
ncbi:hypothetical protein M0802_014175 [Mischocyttarus mexicanus]|nr:hypothetical protein M0802_014175 [Mischocyttarus mexicanus]